MPPELDGVARLYSQSLGVHGPVPQGVGWKTGEDQRLRFDKLATVLGPPGSLPVGVSVNDLGCGYGAMFWYLDRLLAGRLARYSGYEISPDMLSSAKQQVADPRADFLESPRVLRQADYSFACGTFNVKLEVPEDAWTEYMKDTLMNLAEMSWRGFAFNVLSTYVDWKRETLYYADPLMFFDFCKRNISRYVSLLHDYPLYEWTMIVRKGP
jgi:SAM-dependent methyltransferase